MERLSPAHKNNQNNNKPLTGRDNWRDNTWLIDAEDINKHNNTQQSNYHNSQAAGWNNVDAVTGHVAAT